MSFSENLLVKIENAEIGYKKNILIQNLSLQIHRGDKILLLGSNGVGKTTLIKTILGIQRPLQGSISFFYSSCSYVPQALEIPKEFLLTIEETLELYYDTKLFPNKRKHERQKEINEVLKKTNLFEKKHLLLRECSGGELQRTFISRALLRKPELIVFDEPLAAVDVDNQKQFFSLLDTIHKEYQVSILMTSHIMNEDFLKFFSRKLLIKNKVLMEV
ncbi:MAG: ATP-binding cassette domain-containing protein [Leptospiraceae bacterium]|nr:ATP-binding cassette domain-containing protein [Leptospiraceae bacterium]MDW7976867.1 ATP-binding cassette domain-containing protein [Leptospiraceae bacterium]